MIELKNLTKRYKGAAYELIAINRINLKIEDGDFVSIMGASGSGKSTLLNCIGMIDSFEEGEYYLDGAAIHGQSQIKQSILRKEKISFVFQHFELMRNYTVYENIEIPLLARNVKKAIRKKLIYEKAEMLGIHDLLKKYPYQLSGGQQQRTAIVRALVADKPYILADEPTGALDSVNSGELMHLFQMLHEQGKTIIMVTHDKTVAAYADRIITIEDGEIA